MKQEFVAYEMLINNRARVYLSVLFYMVVSGISSSFILFVTVVALGIP